MSEKPDSARTTWNLIKKKSKESIFDKLASMIFGVTDLDIKVSMESLNALFSFAILSRCITTTTTTLLGESAITLSSNIRLYVQLRYDPHEKNVRIAIDQLADYLGVSGLSE